MPDPPRLHQHRDSLPRREAEHAVSQDAQADADLPRVRRQADPRALVAGEDLVEHAPRPAELRLARLALALAAPPEQVRLREAGLEPESRQQRRDGRPAGPRVARADRDALAQELLDRRLEGAGAGQLEVAEGEVGRRRGAQERGGVVALRCGYLLRRERVGPEGLRLGALG